MSPGLRPKSVNVRFSEDEFSTVAKAHQLGPEPWSNLGAWARRVLLAASTEIVKAKSPKGRAK